MRKLLLFAAACLFPSFALGQETYQMTMNVNQVADTDAARVDTNETTCEGYGLPSTCTQADACTAAGAPCAGSCNNAQAFIYKCSIYANSLSGRQLFVNNYTKRTAITAWRELRRRRTNTAAEDLCSLSSGDRTTYCGLFGLGSNCLDIQCQTAP